MVRGGVLKVACAAVVFFLSVIALPAQSFTTLYSFDLPAAGQPSTGVVQGTDGNFYGTTEIGGSGPGCKATSGCGVFFQMTPAGVTTTLYNFCSQTNCPDGEAPNALLRASDGNFYGTTALGGTSTTCTGGCGTVFKITSTGTLTTLYSFCSLTGCKDGAAPFSGLVQGTDGNFYGTTGYGGANNSCTDVGGYTGCGAIFKITPTGTFTALHSFCSQTNSAGFCTDGREPQAAMVQGKNGNFYGTTTFGGNADLGSAFEITSVGALTTLYNFCSQTNGQGQCADGLEPVTGLIQATDGNLYGTTLGGGIYPQTRVPQPTNCDATGCGTVFRITAAGALTTVYKFCSLLNASGTCSDGFDPTVGLTQGTDGNLYGTTFYGGCKNNSCGTLFQLATTGTLTTLHIFCSATNTAGQCEDGQFASGVMQASDGNFYGTTQQGGADNFGSVFRWSTSVSEDPTFTPSSLSFSNTALGSTSAAKSVTVTNSTGQFATLDITSISITGPFAISANTCGATLASGKTCRVSVTFTPTVLGANSGGLSIADNAPSSPQTVPLTGTGIAQATLTPATATFATQAVGTTSTPKAFTLTNNQTTALTGISIATTGDFAMSSTTCTSSLAAKGKCTIDVTFTPTQTGKRTGQLNVSDSASNSPQTAALTGTGK
jgi:uncharacterized repeat protein (TIGR03803 family)